MNHTLDELFQEQNALRVMLGDPGDPVFLDLKPGSLTDVERQMFAHRLRVVNTEIESLLSGQSEFDQN